MRRRAMLRHGILLSSSPENPTMLLKLVSLAALCLFAVLALIRAYKVPNSATTTSNAAKQSLFGTGDGRGVWVMLGEHALAGGDGIYDELDGVVREDAGVLGDGAGVLRDGAGVVRDDAGVLRDGAGVLRDGAGVLRDGAGVLRNDAGVLRDGAGVLRDGAGVLKDGEVTLKDRDDSPRTVNGTRLIPTMDRGAEECLMPEEVMDAATPNKEALLARFKTYTLAVETVIPDDRSVTLVSLFFDLSKLGLKTKHPPDFYLEAGRRGPLAFYTPMIVFTDCPELVIDKRIAVAKKHGLMVVNMSLYDLTTAKLHLTRLNQLAPLDPESGLGYSGELFALYHSKPELMVMASVLNPFHSRKFIWIDMGSVRNTGGIKKDDFIKAPWPEANRMWLVGRDDRVLLQSVAGSDGPCAENVQFVDAETPDLPFIPKYKYLDPLDVPETPLKWWIAGGLFAGEQRALIRYRVIYDDYVTRYLQTSKTSYSLQDQYFMGMVACSSDVVEVVRPPLPCCATRINRQWFFMLMFLKWAEYPMRPFSDAELRARGELLPGNT